VPTASVSKADLLLTLERFLVDAHRAGKRCILVVDEAQNLSIQAVEELRMLSNFQLNAHALLQSFLIGQPEFRHTLQSPQMTQLRQRVIAACHIGPLDGKETQAYIEHRLTCAGWKDSPQFSIDAFAAIHQASGGIPRRINTICDRLLLSGFFSNTRVFTNESVLEVAREIENETSAPAGSAGAAPTMLHPQTPASNASGDARYLVEGLNQENFMLRLTQIEKRLVRIEAAADGLLRNNSSALALLRQLVERMESLSGNPKK
jgi:hypothetical protein